MTDIVKWVATALLIVGALLNSLNIYPAGPALLNLGALLWLIVAIAWREWSLIVINATLLLIYTVGIVVKSITLSDPYENIFENSNRLGIHEILRLLSVCNIVEFTFLLT